MPSDNRGSAESTRIGRRTYLALASGAVAAVAGCSSGGGESTPTPEQPSPGTVTQSFYATLFGENDIDAANAMYHPESPAPELTAENFQRFGGLEQMSTDVQSTTVVSQGEGRARVHAEVLYTTGEGTMGFTRTDYVFLRRHDGEWTVFNWVPERIRWLRAKGTVEAFYGTLFGENSIEGANAMFHPESDAPELSAENFDELGGLETVTASVQSMEVVEEGRGEAEVHAEVEYTTDAGTSTATDHVFLRAMEGEWRLDAWVPERTRGT